MSKNKEKTVSVTLTWYDGQENRTNSVSVNVSKIVSLDIEKQMINIEQLPSGDFRLAMSKELYDEAVKRGEESKEFLKNLDSQYDDPRYGGTEKT